MKSLISLINENERQNVYEIFNDYDALLLDSSSAILDMISSVESYDMVTFDFARARVLRRSEDPIDVHRFPELYEKATALQPRIRELISKLESRRGQRSNMNEVTATLQEMFEAVVYLCQRLPDFKGSGDSLSKVLRFPPANYREVHISSLDPELLTKLKQTKGYIKNCQDKYCEY